MRSGALGIGIGALVIATLAACAPAGPSPGATDSPTPTSPPEALPGVRVPLTCDELIEPQVRESVIGADRAPIVPDESWLASSIAPETAGVKVCVWGTPEGPEDLRLTVTADPADVAQFGPVSSQGIPSEEAPTGTIGDGSSISCGLDVGGLASCTYSVLAGPYWFGGYVHTAAATPDGAAAAVSTMATAIVERLATADPTPLWTPPQRSTVDNDDCSWMDTDGAVAEGIGATGAPTAGGPSGPPIDTLEGLYRDRVGAVWCAIHGDENYLALEYVAGSGWAWESAAEGWSPATVTGAAQAASRCVPDAGSTGCSVRALVGDSIVQADSSGASEPEALERVLAGIAAAIPFLPLEP